MDALEPAAHWPEKAVAGEVQQVRKTDIGAERPFLSSLEDVQAIQVYYTTVREEKEAPDMMAGAGLDFDDSFQFYLARKLDAKLLTLDRHSDRLKGIRVMHP